MSELVRFLEARISEDEAVARAVASPGSWEARRATLLGNRPTAADVARTGSGDEYGPEWVAIDTDGMGCVEIGDAEHIARHDPARVLAECVAKRRIVERYRVCEPHYDEGNRLETRVLHWTMRLLALSYTDHPAYDEAWRP